MKKFGILAMLLSACAFALISTSRALAYPVPQLPENNLLVNPWFRAAADPNDAGLDGWTNVLTNGVGWGLSQKDSNPSPDLLDCNREPGYCGTGARWANENIDGVTVSYPGLDVYLYQVVAADPGHRRLLFSMYWVNHKIDVAEVIVYGSNNPNGPWEEAWLPITIFQDVSPKPCCQPGQNGLPWLQTGMLDTTLESGFAYYKILLHARYPQSTLDQGEVGVKITGVYFSTASTVDSTSLSTPVVVINPTLPGEVEPTEKPPRDGEPTATSPIPTSTPGSTEPPPTATPGSTDPPPTDTDPPRSTPGTGPTETPRARP